MSLSTKSQRAVPAVEKVLHALRQPDLPRPIVVAVVRRVLAELRSSGKVREFDEVVSRVDKVLEKLSRSRIQPVINGTGVVIHTNLGRSPLGPEVARALTSAATHYTNLEYDLNAGERGGRADYLEQALALLCGAEATAVVNNCAAALVLILRHLTAGKRKRVIVSRGELVQIGGGFRIPEILECSGAKLREVGTTNKTTLSDYASAVGPKTALILKVHRGNFFMGGFVESPTTEELAALARKHRLPLVHDLGTGAVSDTVDPRPDHEPTPAESLGRGVDLVCFSGDKLMGGPQAGIIAGSKKDVAALKKEPFYRALRCDKLILAGLQAVVEQHLARQSASTPGSSGSIPALDLIRIPVDDLRERARGIVKALRGVPAKTAVGSGQSRVGGGTLPRTSIESVTLDLAPEDCSLEKLASRLRKGSPPVIGYVSRECLRVDLRTVFPEQDSELTQALRRALEPTRPVAPLSDRARRSTGSPP